MKKYTITVLFACMLSTVLFIQCNQKPAESAAASDDKSKFGGYESQVKWGEHLVLTGGCNDCHTPKKMGPNGPEPDMDKALSGHPAQMPVPEIDRKMLEGKGMAATQTMTAWIGPWGISFAANITSDATGIGNWSEENFIRALREGKYKGIESGRSLLPPMPWQWFKYFSDDELKAIFAYLKSTRPIANVVPEMQPPVSPPPGAPAK